MANLHSLPPAAVLRKWLKHTSKAMEAAAKHPGQVGADTTPRDGQARLKVHVGAGYPTQQRVSFAMDIEE